MKVYTKLSLGIIASFVPIFVPLVASSVPFFPQLLSIEFPSLPKEEAAENTVGAGKRDSCGGEIPLTAIAPKDNIINTLSPTPSLYWFVPQTNGVKAEFILVDSEGNDVYVKEIESTDKSGLVKLTIPESSNLQPRQIYEWQFIIVCSVETENSDLILGNESVAGQIRLVQLTEEQLENLDVITTKSTSAIQLLDKAYLYAEYGLWQETLAILEQLRELDPDLAMQEWSELLNSLGIEGETMVIDSGVSEL